MRVIQFIAKAFFVIIIYLVLNLMLLFVPTTSGTVAVGNKLLKYELAYLVKLAALRERQVYFQAWLDQIIASGLQDPEEKIDKIFEWVSGITAVPASLMDNFGNVEHHEYYTLIKRYGLTSEKVRTFCLLVTIAGYQAVPFQGEADGRVIVRIPVSDTWLVYDLKNRRLREDVVGVHLSDRVKKAIRAFDSWSKKIYRREYTRGDLNIPANRILYLVQKVILRIVTYVVPFRGVTHVMAVNKDKLITVDLSL